MTLPKQSVTLADVARAATLAHLAVAEAHELAHQVDASKEVKDALWGACLRVGRAEDLIAEDL
jgi:hypothetical protein